MSAGPRVLVIDDEESVRDTVRDGLGLMGYDVDTAENGQVGIDKFSEGGFDVVLCDLNMPGMPGVALHRTLLRQDPVLAARVAFVTGGAIRPESRAYLRGQPIPVLAKPFGVPELRAVVRELAKLREREPDAAPPVAAD